MTFFEAFLGRRRQLFVVVCLLTLIGASLGLAIYAESRHAVQVRQTANVQAQILAGSISAALAFDDTEAMKQYTSALRASPEIEAVGVYNEQGKLVAHYGPKAIAGDLKNNTLPSRGSLIVVNAPVIENGVHLGMVYLRQHTEPLATRIARYSGAALLVLMGSLLLTIMGFDARALAAGNAQLKQALIDREKAEAALRQSQKMEAVGRLTGGIAHDFNNMLAVVIGNHDLFFRLYPDADPKMRMFITNAQDAAKRAATLTSRLLAFARRQPLDPRTVDIGKSINGLGDLLERILGENIVIKTKLTANGWRAHVDVGQMETALVNLAINARDAMPGGGTLTITTSNAYLSQEYASAQDEVSPGEYIAIQVSDTGTGMAADVVDKVFEPFFTTKPAGQGTGLGLSQVHGFVKQSGGHISLQSVPGQGTHITLYLPRAQGDAEPILVPQPAETAEATKRNVTVLLVDDEQGVLEFATAALTELGFDVLGAESADQALSIAEKAKHIDVLVTDVVMPVKNGQQLAEALKSTHAHLKILYITGYAHDVIMSKDLVHAGTRLLSKPFTINQLDAELTALLD